MGSARTSITVALVNKLLFITKDNGYNLDLAEAKPFLKFWDECLSFPAIYMSIGGETREYHPGGFKWGFLNISLKVYVKNADGPAEELELILQDIEKVIDNNRQLVYDTTTNASTVEILINSIVTDEGLLEPYGVGEISLTVQYPVL